MNTKDFENRFMQLINGQMPLPQNVFRQFLDWLQENLTSSLQQEQDVTDESLETTAKTVPAAINEVNTLAGAASTAANAALPASAISFDTDTLTITVNGHTYALSATEVVGNGEE